MRDIRFTVSDMKEKNKIFLEEILASKSLMDFVEAARSFCLLIETQQSDDSNEFLKILNGQLLTLYTLGFKLPVIFIGNIIDFNKDVTREEILEINKFIAQRVPISFYWTVLEPLSFANPQELALGDLIDDLSDIYKDLKRALMQFDNEKPEAKENAVWQFKFDFDNHWEQHCIDACHIISHFLFDNK